MTKFILLLTLSILLTGCGFKGDLYLPSKNTPEKTNIPEPETKLEDDAEKDSEVKDKSKIDGQAEQLNQ